MMIQGRNIFLSMYFESEVAFGKGWAYGTEFFLRKKTGKLKGWVGYTIAKSERQFDEINHGKSFPANFDRTHDISIVANYRFNEKWTFSTTWVYFTGTPITIPYGKYSVDGITMNLYSDRNAYRIPDYHRLDIGATYTTKNGNSWCPGYRPFQGQGTPAIPGRWIWKKIHDRFCRRVCTFGKGGGSQASEINVDQRRRYNLWSIQANVVAKGSGVHR